MTAFNLTQTGIPGIIWPPLVNGPPAPLAALMYQLEATQWLTSDELAQQQYLQLVTMAQHAVDTSPFFSKRMADAGLIAEQLNNLTGLRKLPVMSRRELQSAGEKLFCTRIPKAHLPIVDTQSSGSSGEPVTVKRTAINHLLWLASALREHLWHERDFAGKLAIIRVSSDLDKPKDLDTWGPPVGLFYKSGTSHAMSLTTDVSQQVDWLAQINPDYLLTYPTNLAALLEEFEKRGIKHSNGLPNGLSNLRQIRTIGETLPSGLRDATRKSFGVEIADIYSSQEVGNIALQCPQSSMYHIMSESLIVEILDEQGLACLPGQTGRVVVTDLHNFATPLIRYDIGDYAEVGEVCSCGRGLPTLKRIVGRERNMIKLPNGSRHWPLVGAHSYREVAPIRQYQVIQRSLALLEVRLVTDVPLNVGQEERLAEIIHKTVGHPFQLEFVYFDQEIPRGRGGKFEEFICEI